MWGIKVQLALAALRLLAAPPLPQGDDPPLPVRPAEPQLEEQEVRAAEPQFPSFAFRGFADLTFFAESDPRPSPDGAPSGDSAFALGMLDFFLTANLSRNLTFLAEVVVELEEDGQSEVDPERFLLKYAWSDAFRVAIGRSHTALGYWNEAYHHGLFLQPTVNRPQGLEWEDSGGVLPVHSVGLELSGRARTGPWEVAYVANLANGRGKDRETVQTTGDLNDEKAAAGKVSASYSFGGGGLVFGASAYRDVIPANREVAGREGEMDELIRGAHLRYRGRRLEVLGEFFAIRHQDQATRREFDHVAWYALVIGRLGRWQPYVGVDVLDFEPGDLFYAPDDEDLDRYLVGIRYDIAPVAALKVEARRDERPTDSNHVLALQAAFTF